MSPARRGLEAYVAAAKPEDAADSPALLTAVPEATPAAAAARVADKFRQNRRAADEARGDRADDRAIARKAPARKSRRVTSADVAPAGDAWEQVMAARNSAQDSPEEWGQLGVRLPAALAMALKARWAADRQRPGGKGLAVGHYVSAALATVPAAPGRAAGLGMAWRRAHRGDGHATAGSGYRAHQDVRAAMDRLGAGLRLLPGTVKLWEVQAAAVAAFLDGLVPDEQPAEVITPATPQEADGEGG